MALTKHFKETVAARVERDPAFAKAHADEATALFLKGEPQLARAMLRDLVNATVGFEELGRLTRRHPKSLHRMLSPRGNPGMDQLSGIFKVLFAKVSKLRGRRGVQPPGKMGEVYETVS